MGLRRPWNARHSRPSNRYLPSGETASFHLRPSQNQLASGDQPGGDGVNASCRTPQRFRAWPESSLGAAVTHLAATLTSAPEIAALPGCAPRRLRRMKISTVPQSLRLMLISTAVATACSLVAAIVVVASFRQPVLLTMRSAVTSTSSGFKAGGISSGDATLARRPAMAYAY